MKWKPLLLLVLVFQTLLITSDAFLQNSSTFDLDIFDYDEFRRNGKENKCVNENSPANDCFDYFTLAVVWTYGYGYKQLLKNIPIRDNLSGQWIIHGLWPSWYGEVNPKCPKYTEFFVEYRLQNEYYESPTTPRENLHTLLARKWFSVFKRYPKNLWDHEFKKHGSCATRATKIKDMVGYFRKTYTLFDELRLQQILPNEGFEPGRKEKLSRIVEIMKKQVKMKVKVDFVRSEDQNEPANYLTEFFICYDLNLEAMDCPFTEKQDRNPDLEITYPNKVPPVPR